MTSQYKTFSIRVYPLVRKFLEYHYGSGPFEVSNIRNPYASFLYIGLDRFDNRDTQEPRRYQLMTDELELAVSNWRDKSFGQGQLSPMKVAAFNGFVQDSFYEKMTYEVIIAMMRGIGIKTAIERFTQRYGITPDELPYDRAIRYYFRYRKKILLECCPERTESDGVILSHERDKAIGQMESGRRQVA